MQATLLFSQGEDLNLNKAKNESVLTRYVLIYIRDQQNLESESD